MGKRDIGQLSVMDLIVSIFIAEVAAISIENYDKSILMSIIPIVVLVILQILVSYISLKNKNIRDSVDGRPSMIIKNGEINFNEMMKQRYNIDDLLVQLREASVKSIEDVDFAVLETSGKLSIFKKSEDELHLYPLPIIIDGIIEEDVLGEINKSKDWIISELKKQNIKLENIFYSFYKDNELFIIEKDKIK